MFDLGLALSFQDNASRGLKNVVGTMQNLTESINEAMGKLEEFSRIERLTGKNLSAMKDMAMGTLLTQVGGAVTSVGKSIGGIFTSAANSVINVSKEVKSARITIDNLWGGAKKGAEAFNKMKEYAMTSTFEFKDLLSTMIMMKAVGIDINDTLTTTSGKTQKITDYAGDLAALFPDMRNMYGHGIRASMGAIKEFIAEGNTRQLLTGAGLDIETVLGEKKGGDIKTRSRQIADLIEKINAFGMTANMMGQPAQRLSNLSDILFNLQYQMSESGKVYEKYSEIVKNLTEPLMKIDNKTWFELGKSLGEAFNVILDPLVSLSKYIGSIIPKFIDFIKQNPALVKIAVTIGTIASAGLILAGALLTLGGSVRLIQFAYKGLIPLQKGFLAFLKISNALSKASLISFGQWAVALFLFYKAYQTNFMGIKTLLQDVGNVLEATVSLLMGNGLSVDTFNYLRERGLIPLVESLYAFGRLMQNFFLGMSEGFTELGKSVVDFLDSFSKTTGIDLSGLIQSIKDLTDLFGGHDAEKIKRQRQLFREIGNTVAKIVVPFMLFGTVLRVVVGGIWKFLTPIRWVISHLLKWTGVTKIVKAVLEQNVALPLKRISKFLFNHPRIFLKMLKDSIDGINGFKILNSLAKGRWKIAFVRILRELITMENILNAFKGLGGFLKRAFLTKIYPLLGRMFFGIVKGIGGLLTGAFGLIPALVILALIAIATIVYTYWDDIKAWCTKKWAEFSDWVSNKWGEVWKSISDTWNNFNFKETALYQMFESIWDKAKSITDEIAAWGRKAANSKWWSRPLIDNLRDEVTVNRVTYNEGITEPPADYVQFATGGETKDEGFAYLHPNEAILNSGLTKRLGDFLARTSTNNVNYGGVNISINVDHMDNDTDLNALADKLMKIMDRKMQLKKMAVRV